MYVMKHVLIILLILGVFPVKGQLFLNLETCREMALESSKKMSIAEQQGKKAESERKAYRANFLPKLSATGLYAYVQKKTSFTIDGGYLPTFVPDANGNMVYNFYLDPSTNLPVIGKDGLPLAKTYAYMPDIELELGLRGVYSAGAMLEQPIYMGGKIRSAYHMATIGKEMSELNKQYTRAEVITETDEAYWQYLRVVDLVTSAQKYKAVVGELVKNLTDAFETGMASRNDLLKAQVKLNEAELMLQKAENGKALASMNLCRVIGIDLHTAIQVSDTLHEEVTPGVLNAEEGLQQRPEYNLLEKDIELKEKQVALTRSDFLPEVGVSASYGYSGGISLNGQTTDVASFTAMASVKIPIYHWGEGRGKIKAMKAEQEMSRLKIEERSQMMLLEIARARYNIEDSHTRVLLTRKSLSQAEENLSVSKNQYEVGMETITNYMEAQAQWQKAWSDWIDAKTELRLSETRYLKATGRL